MPRDLLKFLFESSFAEEGILEAISEKMQEIETPKFDPAPLEKVLKKLGVDAEVTLQPSGPSIHFDAVETFNAARSVLRDASNIHTLAVAGWVATFGDEVTDTTEPRSIPIYFIQIDKSPSA